MKVSQPKRWSATESIINVIVGLVINITAQIFIYPLFGMSVSFNQNLEIAGIFTIISIIRSYSLRRVFNFIHIKLYGN